MPYTTTIDQDNSAASSIPIDSIIVGERHRRDLGDIAALAKNIDAVGALLAENTCRKDFTLSEAVAIKRALEPLEKAAAKERQGARTDKHPGKLPTSSMGRAADKAAKATGRARRTLEKAEAIVDAPDVLRDIVETALNVYYDRTLAARVSEAKEEWEQEAEAAIRKQVDPTILANLREEAGERLAELRSIIDDINERMRLAADDFTLPAIEVPEPEVDEDASRQPLVSFNDNWIEATRALIARKQYEGGSL